MMIILSREAVPFSGFAGIKEHRIVKDSQFFKNKNETTSSNGIGNMVYLADAQYDPSGESGMHPHSEIDVISMIIDGRVSHEGSMEHGKDLRAGDVQVQRAGGEGFSHNEKNPDHFKNRMLQIWVLPEKKDQCASYKFYTPELEGISRIYGGNGYDYDTFTSRTIIDIYHIKAGEQVDLKGEHLSYVINGRALFTENKTQHQSQVGDLIRSTNSTITAQENLHMVSITYEHSAPSILSEPFEVSASYV